MTRSALLLGLAALAAAGCGSPEVKPLDDETMAAVKHIQKVGVAYNRAAQAKRKPPASVNDLKPYLKREPGAPDPLVSLADGKSIVVVPGVSGDTAPEPGARSIVAYEQTGVNGKRMMVDVRGMVHTVTDAEFAEIKFAGGHRPK